MTYSLIGCLQISSGISDRTKPNATQMNVISCWAMGLPEKPAYLKNIPKHWITQFNSPPENAELFLPLPNPYICDEFSLLESVSSPPEDPNLEFQDTRGELWFMPDYKFQKPQTCCSVLLTYPTHSVEEHVPSTSKMVMANLLQTLFDEVFAEDIDQLEKAFYSLNIKHSPAGMELHLDGFSQNFIAAFEHSVKLIKTFGSAFDEITFNRTKAETVKKNLSLISKPCVLPWLYSKIILDGDWPDVTLTVNALDALTFEEFVHYCQDVLKTSYVKMLIGGNVTPCDARKVFEVLQEQVEVSAHPPSLTCVEERVRKLKTGSWIAKLSVSSTVEVHSYVRNLYQDLPGSLHDSYVHDLLLRIMEVPLFDFLRTEQQLGYDIECSSELTGNTKCLIIKVVTPAHEHSVEEVDQKIDEFLISFADTLKTMSSREFQDFIETKKDEVNTVDTSFWEKHHEYWRDILHNDYSFGTSKEMCAELFETEEQTDIISKLTLDDVLLLFERLTSPQSESFRKLSIQVDVQSSASPELKLGDTLNGGLRDLVQCSAPPEDTQGRNYISNLLEYRDSLEFFPAN